MTGERTQPRSADLTMAVGEGNIASRARDAGIGARHGGAASGSAGGSAGTTWSRTAMRDAALCEQVRPPSLSLPKSTRYYASFGPQDGPVQYRDRQPTIGVFARSRHSLADVYPVGTAHPAAWIVRNDMAVATFRLVIGSQELGGRWVCNRRRFVLVDDAGDA